MTESKPSQVENGLGKNPLVDFLIDTNKLVPYSDFFLDHRGINDAIVKVDYKNWRIPTLKNDTPYSNFALRQVRVHPEYREHFNSLPQSEQDNIRLNHERKLAELRKLVAGKPIVDIGAGSSSNGYELACLLGASAYIAIEPFYYSELVRSIDDFQKDNQDNSLSFIPYLCLAESVHTAVKRLPDNSVSFMCFGIDSNILGRVQQREWDPVIKETVKKLSPNGAYITDWINHLKPNVLTEHWFNADDPYSEENEKLFYLTK